MDYYEKTIEKETYVIVSGGFDPIHIGHVRMIQDAANYGDGVIVIVNNDNWLKTKKKYNFMDEKERLEIVYNIKGVMEAFLTNHEVDDVDRSVVKSLEYLKQKYPDNTLIFANGGDRKEGNVPEYEFCDQYGIKMIFDVGGDKIQSSSELVENDNKR
jgi:cytidyltransferase-like protein